MNAIELITKEDLDKLKTELLGEIKLLLQPIGSDKKQWLKSHQVRKLLGISPGTLQTLRINGTLPYTKVGGTLFYKADHINKVLEDNLK